MTPTRRTKTVLALGDMHTGHSAGLVPPDWQGCQPWLPDKLLALQKACWEFYVTRVRQIGPVDLLILNGDLIDGRGEKSGGLEQIVLDRHEQCEMAIEAAKVVKAKRTVITYGCLTPGHRILTADMRWVPVETLNIGDALVGFDPESRVDGGKRKWRTSIVKANIPTTKEVYRLHLSDGTTLTATPDHPFLVRGGGPMRWRTVAQMHRHLNGRWRKAHDGGIPFARVMPTWDTDQSRAGGYIAGFFDGEGCVSAGKRIRSSLSGESEYVFRVGADQKNNLALLEITEALTERDVAFSVTGKGRDPNMRHVAVLGQMPVKLQFLGRFRPRRLLGNLEIDEIGFVRTSYTDNCRIVAIEPAGEQTVMGLSTSTETYVSEGFLSHNTGYHVGNEEDYEALIAQRLGASIGSHEWIEVNGQVFDCKHHLGSSGIPHGRHTAIAKDRLWNLLWSDVGEQPRGSIFLRSHVHYHQHCGGPGWLAMTLPALQAAATKYGGRRCSGTVDFGVTEFHIEPTGAYSWQAHIARLPAQQARALKL